ncbi:hypothetical protein BKI52_09600 [marine bacterium AO1-C]|nr:hypothetical protein BKI52_09600 [marine bacterium AO1-C]
MKQQVYIIVGIVIAVILVYSFSSTNTSQKPTKDYATRIMEMRLKKDQYFRTASDSPFKNDRSQVKNLKYYTPDKNFRVTAKLEVSKEPETMEMGTSKGTREIYYKYGFAHFTIADKKLKLLVLKKELNDKMLFVPFTDKTSGGETYGAGRYLDVAQTKPNEITLDFNQAYSPYCAYNEAFVCPMPPSENNLEVAIKAGEKNFKQQ